MHYFVRWTVIGLALGGAVAAAGGATTLGQTIESSTLPFMGPQAIALGDIDRDGKLDAAVVGGGASALFACFRGAGTGAFGEQIAGGSLYLQPMDLVVGDFNGDGRIDVAGLNNACT